MTDYDPEQVAIRPAATVMLVDDRPDLQVFMMERHADTVFAGGMWVFPGGSVDHTDRNADDISVHRTDRQASDLMGLPRGGLAYYIAAIREAFEEAGILLALHRDTLSRPDFTDAEIIERFQDHRDELNAQQRDFLDILAQENLVIDGGAMHYIARWITPRGPPRRFDARFFIAQMPHDQTPIHDDGELVHSRWLSPQVILEKVETEEMVLMTPTLRMIKNLALFSSAEEVMAAAGANLPDHRARVGGDSNTIIMPGEPGYETAARHVESGWVRLRPL
ncbi:MAG: NUDIX hydrolase [Proteobacteria bacterium]|nr:NUDIX hydrolase [Pseudomonadota bacterium]MDA1299801.1 NUDIX hydrolase [Pseudomonadota bacterium]